MSLPKWLDSVVVTKAKVPGPDIDYLIARTQEDLDRARDQGDAFRSHLLSQQLDSLKEIQRREEGASDDV